MSDPMDKSGASSTAQGPLAGVRVLEFAGIGPAPFCGMLLSDLGADVILIDRPGRPPPAPDAVTYRGRRHLPLDLKDPASIPICLSLLERADLLIEGFRPGVMERLGLGPEIALSRNVALVYGRMTGWGQHGPLAQRSGHDINYIAISGALHAIGPADKPVPPLNLVGDFGGGALYLAFGLLAAHRCALVTGIGQVVDCAISDGAASLMAMLYGYKAAGRWADRREANRLDGGAHFYDTYRCADGKWVAVGAIEPQFYREFLTRLGLESAAFDDPANPAGWARLKAAIGARLLTKSRDDWAALLEPHDACFAPILAMGEAPGHHHNAARNTFVEHGGVVQPAPAPRFSRTPGAIQVVETGPDPVTAAMAAWGCDEADRRPSAQPGGEAGQQP